MNAARFNLLALRTERPIDADVQSRMEKYAPYVHDLLMRASALADEADGLKRAIYYGKCDRLKLTEHEPVVTGQCRSRINENLRAVHGLLGMVSESGELVASFSNHWHGHHASVDSVNVLEECGDAAWYLALTLDSVGSNLGESMEAVLSKLAQRYPDRFTEHDAIDRNILRERRALEAGVDGDGKF